MCGIHVQMAGGVYAHTQHGEAREKCYLQRRRWRRWRAHSSGCLLLKMAHLPHPKSVVVWLMVRVVRGRLQRAVIYHHLKKKNSRGFKKYLGTWRIIYSFIQVRELYTPIWTYMENWSWLCIFENQIPNARFEQRWWMTVPGSRASMGRVCHNTPNKN